MSPMPGAWGLMTKPTLRILFIGDDLPDERGQGFPPRSGAMPRKVREELDVPGPAPGRTPDKPPEDEARVRRSPDDALEDLGPDGRVPDDAPLPHLGRPGPRTAA